MKLLFKFIGYVVGIVFILAGIAGLITYETGKLAGAFYILAGISILPPVISKLRNKIKHTLVFSIASFLIFTVIGGLLAPLYSDVSIVDRQNSENIAVQTPPEKEGEQIKEEEATVSPTPEPEKIVPIVTPPMDTTVDNKKLEIEALSLIKKTVGNDSKTIEAIYEKETSITAVTAFGWAVIKNPKGDGWYVAYKTEVSGNESLPIWWITNDKQIYWVNGKASSRTNKALQQIPFNASGMTVSDIYTLMESQKYSE